MPAFPSFPLVPDGYDPARVDAFIERLIDRSRKEITEARSRAGALEADLAEAYEVMKAADVRIRTLEMDLERVLEGFAHGAGEISAVPEPDEVSRHEEDSDPADEAPPVAPSPSQEDDDAVDELSVPFTEPPPELNEMEEKAAKAERAIRGRFLSSTKR